MDDEIYLICQTFEMDALNQQIPREHCRKVWCRISSITRAEWRDAAMQGLKPELMAAMPIVNYSGELIAEYNGARYSIYRTFRDLKSDEIELYLSREVGV